MSRRLGRLALPTVGLVAYIGVQYVDPVRWGQPGAPRALFFASCTLRGHLWLRNVPTVAALAALAEAIDQIGTRVETDGRVVNRARRADILRKDGDVPSVVERFRGQVIDPIQVNVGGRALSYADYVALSATERSNDEADVVDRQFTTNLLRWLGFDDGDLVYNRTASGGKSPTRPDFRVLVLGGLAFVVEDKSTDETFDEGSIDQLRRYTAGTAGYCLWTNARTVLGLRFDATSGYRRLVEVRVEDMFGHQPGPYSQEANLSVLETLFQRSRFAGAAELLASIAMDEPTWRKETRPLTDGASIHSFILESNYVLGQLATAARARLVTMAAELEEAAEDLRQDQLAYRQIVDDLLGQLEAAIPAARQTFLPGLRDQLHSLEPVLAEIDVSQVDPGLSPEVFSSIRTIWNREMARLRTLIANLRERELSRAESRRIRAAYLVWRERYQVTETEEGPTGAGREAIRYQAFAEQVAYVFFVRLLLTRILEDKQLMPRLVSDGGFGIWYQFLESYDVMGSPTELQGSSFLPLVYRRVASYYQHFFQQPAFDWFTPDDYLIALILRRLNDYDFGTVTSDILGFAYEAFIDRTARNRKGHFLTPPDVVDYILDRMGYTGSRIIGQLVLDPACGSGSFLVHAARRLRAALADSFQRQGKSELELAEQFVNAVKEHLVGLEINPFSCYLAELNLFVQVLDDLALLWRSGARPDVEQFAIYNTNSLELPWDVLHGAKGTFSGQITALDEAGEVKRRERQFGYVVCNPPYVNRGIILGMKSYNTFPFYKDILRGDENLYLLFLRLAAYYVADGGTICFICPLNLFGDESGLRAREYFNDYSWTIASLTRFYTRDVLFPGVLQGVCVVRFDRHDASPTDLVAIRGGRTVAEASAAEVSVERHRITESQRAKTTWFKVWLVNADVRAYDLWDSVRQVATEDLEDRISGRLTVHKGDVRSTWSRPIEVPHSTNDSAPLTKGSYVVDWGDWLPASYLDPWMTIPPSTSNLTSVRWVQRRVQRVAQLTQPETVLFLKEVSGLEMKRPIRGSFTMRDSRSPVVADETLLVMYTTEPRWSNLATAVFGLLTSAAFNYLFALFSTNPHANYREILRLPIPPWSAQLEHDLADATRACRQAHDALHQHQARFGSGDDANVVSAPAVLTALRGQTFRLEDLINRGEMALTGSQSWTLDALRRTNRLTFDDTRLDPTAIRAINVILDAHGSLVYSREGKDVRLPAPQAAGRFLSFLAATERERNTLVQTVREGHTVLDEMITRAYGIDDPAYQQLIEAGVPWAH